MAEKDYAETLFQAIDLLVNKRIESVKFDETIDAVVVDASKASSGQYVVSTGNAKFVAYSLETTYKVNDAVMVTIPQGNYDNQKMIIGKAVDNTNTPMIYKSPFQQLVNVSNNLIQGHKEIGFWANYTSPLKGKYWSIDNADFKGSVAYQYTEQNNNTITTVINSFWDSGEIFEQGFSQLGLQAQFSTWLGEYGTAFGNYGLAVELTFKCLDIPDPEAPGDPSNTFTNILTFDSDEFFGDVYNFETYYTQENVYDISDYLEYPIVRIRLFVYQRGNFKDTDGQDIYPIPTPQEEEDEFSSIGPNIFIKDPYICLGISATDFQKDTITLLTDSSLTYYKEVKKISDDPVEYETVQQRDENNRKIICARWIHRNVEEDTIAAVQNNELPPGYEVRWYRFKLGAPSADLFSGAHWERFYGWKDEPDEETWDYGITQDEIDNNLAEDIAKNNLEIQFIPNVNYETEKLKAVVLRNDGMALEPIFRLVAASNVIEFVNDDDVRSEATLVDANALSIRYDDDEKGHYFLYNEAGDVGKNEDSEVRTLTAVFDENTTNVYEKAELNVAECYSVTWTFPDANANTMIVPMTSPAADAVVATPVNGQFIYTGVNKVGFTIKKHLNNGATQNTIRLDVVKDGLNYSAFIQPIFGTAGTNGSDYTLILTWLDDKNAIDIAEDYPTLRGELALQDQAGNILEWPADAKVECDWLVAEVLDTEVQRIKEQEDADIFYPVFKTFDEALLYGNGNNPEAEDQPNGFYYFLDQSAIQDVTYYTFNPEIGTFVEANYAEATGNLYRKCINDNEKKNKLEFRPITNFDSPPLNVETGVITDSNTAIDLEWDSINEKYIKKYYYSSQQRYFIQFNGRYVLDPWDTYQEVETYYEPIEAPAKMVRPGILTVAAGDGEEGHEPKNIITISRAPDIVLSMNSLFILSVTLTNFGDYDLVTYFPIPFKDSSIYNTDYIDGADRVRYAADGTIDFVKNPYQIVARKRVDDNLITYRHGYPDLENGNNLDGYWKLLIVDSEDHFYPVLNETAIDITTDNHTIKEVVDGKYDIPLLQPVTVYIPEATPYGVQFYGFYYTLIPNAEAFATITDVYNAEGQLQTPKPTWNTEEGATNTFYQRQVYIIWTQPILVYESRYPSRTLNKWNGRDIETDEEAGTILASGFAAGKKERDNSFTGVVLGDWSRSVADSAITKNTGIYGFNHGAMSYAFKDDGTGFIGKDSRGRIYFDGNKAQIFSSEWANKIDPKGMLLDIDDGSLGMKSIDNVNVIYTKITGDVAALHFTGANQTLPSGITNIYKKAKDGGWQYIQVLVGEAYSSSNYYYIKASGTRYITLGANQPRTPLSIGTTQNVQDRHFRVDWDGTLHVIDGDFQGDINGSNIYGGTISGSYIYAGKLEARNGEIAGWVMGADSSNGDYLINKDRTQGTIVTLHSRLGILTNQFRILSRKPEDNGGYVEIGQIGELSGWDTQNTTTLLGIKASSTAAGRTYSIVLEASADKNIRLSGPNQAPCQSIYMYASSDIVLCGGYNALTGLYAKMNNMIIHATNLAVTTPAANQTGIYARFA